MRSRIAIVGIFIASTSAWAKAPSSGDVLKIQSLGEMSAAQVAQLRTQYGLDALNPTSYGVHFYKILYSTPDLSGQLSAASGLLVIPEGSAPEAYPMVSYQHGTNTSRTDVPSQMQSPDALVSGGFYGASGYIVAAADYLGLGDSPGVHPYLNAKTEASASADMIHAARNALATLNVAYSDKLFLAGYSQGGHATMALHQHLQMDLGSEYRVTASAPMAGPFDLSVTSFKSAFDHPSENSSLYTAYIARSMNAVYGNVYNSPSEIFQSPYDQTVDGIFDGTHSNSQVVQALPASPQLLFRPEFLNALANDPNHPLNRDLRDNDVYDWKPDAPVALVQSSADQDVPYHNAELTYDRMTALGANVELVDLGTQYTHAQAAGPAIYLTLQWFNGMK